MPVITYPETGGSNREEIGIAIRMRVGAAALASLVLAGCGLAGAGGGGGAGPHAVALRVAIVANPQMQDVESLTSAFEKQNPAIKVNYVTLPENESRLGRLVAWPREHALRWDRDRRDVVRVRGGQRPR